MGYKADLIESARQFDAEQAQRAREFNAQADRALGRKEHERTPITWAELRRHANRYLYTTCLPGRTMPWMLFGLDYANHFGYVPIERRFELVSKRFNEIYSQGEKTPRRDMTAVN